jgi:Asp-tRNA(Asn)/Glu-tRNA(Gln) amidotransferase C subunit
VKIVLDIAFLKDMYFQIREMQDEIEELQTANIYKWTGEHVSEALTQCKRCIKSLEENQEIYLEDIEEPMKKVNRILDNLDNRVSSLKTTVTWIQNRLREGR